jgi:hypothetical protein
MDRVSLSERARMKRHDGRGTRQDQEDLDKRKRAKEFSSSSSSINGFKVLRYIVTDKNT